jgi:hypothetical protein
VKRFVSSLFFPCSSFSSSRSTLSSLPQNNAAEAPSLQEEEQGRQARRLWPSSSSSSSSFPLRGQAAKASASFPSSPALPLQAQTLQQSYTVD